jgi:hypothetical protein
MFMTLELSQWAAGHEIAGAVFMFRPGEVHVWRWDPREEDLRPVDDTDEAQRLQTGVQNFDFDAYLGPFRESASCLHAWLCMSCTCTNAGGM